MTTTEKEDKTYNGWTNYETWNVALWIGNEQGSQDFWQERARQAYDAAQADKYFTKAERAKLDLAEILKEDLSENTPTVTGFYADLLNAALSEVNHYEIVSHWIDEIEADT